MPPIILAALLLTADPESAAATAWRACIDRTTTNDEWGRCGGDYIRRVDMELNSKWTELMAATQGQTKADLVTEEKAWIAYKETACRFYENGDWGREGQVLHGPACLAQVIERRTRQLSIYLDFIDQK